MRLWSDYVDNMRLVRILRRRGRSILIVLVTLVILNISGLFLHLFERSIDDFEYPLNVPNLEEIIEKRIAGEPSDELSPINSYNSRFVIRNENKCKIKGVKGFGNADQLDDEDAGHDDEDTTSDIVLVYVIKSALNHRRGRDAIRKSWGFEERFSDVSIRRVFMLGSCQSLSSSTVMAMAEDLKQDGKSCQDMIDEEAEQFKDIVQGDFIDTYYNNTYKTMMGMRWLIENCQNVQFALFVDDDYYVSTKNLLKFVRDPFGEGRNHVTRSQNDVLVDPLGGPGGVDGKYSKFDGRLYSGYVFEYSRPMRHKTSKWFVSLEEYPYSRYPPYVTAGAFVLSNRALKQLYYASCYVQHFRFDDIYIGILAKKMRLVPLHSPEFYFYRKDPSAADFSSVIASHGFDDTIELTRTWSSMKSQGYA